MSIIQTIRDKGTWLIFTLLVLALIAFIFMDANKRDIFGGSNGQSSSMGSVNGSSIDRKEYNESVEALKALYSEDATITESRIEGYVWNNMVDAKLMEKEYKPFDNDFTDEQLIAIAVGRYGRPNQHVLKMYEKSGLVDMQSQQIIDPARIEGELKMILASKANENGADIVRGILHLVKAEYLAGKYSELMAATTFVPAWMAKKQMNESNVMGKLSFVRLPYSDISDSAAEVKLITDAEIQTYIDKYPSLYRQDESRMIDYVVYDFSPTASDTVATRNTMEQKKVGFSKVADSVAFEYVYNNNTETQPDNRFVRRKDITIKGDSGALAQGVVYGPYYDNGKYSLARVTEIKSMPDSANVRHILVATYDQQQNREVRSDADAKALMDSVVRMYRAGMSFDTLVKRYSEDPGSKDTGGVYKNVKQNQMVPEFNEFLFTKKPGDTGVIRTQFGYHFIQVLSHNGASTPAYKVAYLSKSVIPSDATRDSVLGVASGFSANNRDAKTFDEAVKKNAGTIVKQGPLEISKDAGELQAFPDRLRNTLIKWVFNHKPGEVSEAFALDKSYRYVVVKLISVNPEGKMSLTKARPQVEAKLRIDKKFDILSKKFGKAGSLQDIANKAVKQIETRDSIGFADGNIKDVGIEPRVAGYLMNAASQGKVSGPVKGATGVFYVQVEGGTYARPNGMTDEKMFRSSAQGQQKNASRFGSASMAYRRKATIKDKRLDD
jgi:peptidyl-prolyl cis-trans isomerase D